MQPDAIAGRRLTTGRTKFLLVGAGITSFVLFTLVFTPASTVTNRLPASVRIGGVEGTLWSGQARSVVVSGWQLHDTRWDLNPLALLLGRLSARVSTQVAGGKATGNASVSLFGNVAVSDLDATGSLAPIAAQLKLPVTGGQYQIGLTQLDVTDGWPTSLIGSVKVTDVPLNIIGTAGGPTGSYAVVFDADTVAEDGRLTGLLSDDGGPIEVGGNVVLTPPANYELQAKVKPRPNAPADMTRALTLFAPAGQDGRHELSMAGSL